MTEGFESKRHPESDRVCPVPLHNTIDNVIVVLADSLSYDVSELKFLNEHLQPQVT